MKTIRKRRLWILLVGIGLLILPGHILNTFLNILPSDMVGPLGEYTSTQEIPLIVAGVVGIQVVLTVYGICLIIRYIIGDKVSVQGDDNARKSSE